MYRSSSYFWSKLMSEIPMSFFIPFIVITITYWGIGYNNEEATKYPMFLLAMWLVYNAFAGLGYILGTAIANKQVINILSPLIIVPQMLFTGFFVNQSNIPWFLMPFQHVSIHKYAYQAFFLIEFTGLKMECMSSEDPATRCDPVGDFDSPQTLWASLYTMMGIALAGYLIAFCILYSKSRDYD